MYLAIIIQDFYLNALWLLVILSASGLLWVFYNQFFKPYLELKEKEMLPPPPPGSSFVYIVSESERTSSFVIGRAIGNIATRCAAISDEHLVFTFKKDDVHEEYDITIKRSAPVLIKPPRTPTYSVMDSTEKLESHEVIGKTADFRISNQINKERMINFIEISLSSKFIINKNGKERLQFIFTITKIQPGLAGSPDKTGHYPWGKAQSSEEED